MNLFEITKKTNTDLSSNFFTISEEFKSLETVEDKEKKSYAHTRNLLSWVKKQLKKIDKTEGKSTRISGQDAKEGITEFLNWLQGGIDSIEKVDSTTASSEMDRTDLSKKDTDKIMRVRPKKFKKNTEGQDEPEQEDEEVDLIPENNGTQ